jgi:hypothetical protein
MNHNQKPTKEDYYALINHMGRQRYYHVTASKPITSDDAYDIRIEYVDYNPNREWGGVWIKESAKKIIKTFDDTTEEYKYFNSLKCRFKQLVDDEILACKKRSGTRFLTFIGTSNILKCYKKAVKEVPKPKQLH